MQRTMTASVGTHTYRLNGCWPVRALSAGFSIRWRTERRSDDGPDAEHHFHRGDCLGELVRTARDRYRREAPYLHALLMARTRHRATDNMLSYLLHSVHWRHDACRTLHTVLQDAWHAAVSANGVVIAVRCLPRRAQCRALRPHGTRTSLQSAPNRSAQTTGEIRTDQSETPQSARR